jgi:hypothetical protein
MGTIIGFVLSMIIGFIILIVLGSIYLLMVAGIMEASDGAIDGYLAVFIVAMVLSVCYILGSYVLGLMI